MLRDTNKVLCLHHFIIWSMLTTSFVGTQELRPPAPEFKRHALVQPAVQHARTKRDIYSTREPSGAHHSEVTMRVPGDGEELILDLRLNQLITDNHVLTYQENGKTVHHKTKKEGLCQYVGSVRDKPGSWVALSTCHGVQGTVFDGAKMKYIEPAQGGEITSQHYVYDHSDLSVHHKCGFDGALSKHTHHISKEHLRSRQKRRTQEARVPAPHNAHSSPRYVELVLVADHALFLHSGGDIDAILSQMTTLANIINSVYTPLNIFVSLVNVEVWNKRDEIILWHDSEITLDSFLKYRQTKLLKRMPNDNAHLITGEKFKDNVVGRAYKSTMCSTYSSGGVSYKHTNVTGLQAMTIAHELGHNLGMDHDDRSCRCPGRKCIMSAASTAVVPTHWSSCSSESLEYFYSLGLDYCLRNKPSRLFGSPNSPMPTNRVVKSDGHCSCSTISAPVGNQTCKRRCKLVKNILKNITDNIIGDQKGDSVTERGQIKVASGESTVSPTNDAGHTTYDSTVQPDFNTVMYRILQSPILRILLILVLICSFVFIIDQCHTMNSRQKMCDDFVHMKPQSNNVKLSVSRYESLPY